MKYFVHFGGIYHEVYTIGRLYPAGTNAVCDNQGNYISCEALVNSMAATYFVDL